MLMQVDHILMLVLMAVHLPMGMLGGMLMMVVFMFMLMAVHMGMLMRM
jgi:hypothetical protein